LAHSAMMVVICTKPERFAAGVVGCMHRRDRGPLDAG
jgi:hypothetical protein